MKDAYYFSHDSNARNDQRIMKLRMKHGMIGYGIYWAIIEILREQEKYSLNIKDINSIVYELREPEAMILSVIKDFDLFVIKNNVFYSRSLKKRMSLKAAKSDKARESARARWDKTDQEHNNKNANAMRTHSERNAIKESKVKESNNIYVSFLKHFNETVGRNFRGCDKSKRNFYARIKQGYTIKDFQKAIVSAKADKFHVDNDYKYITPEFITRQDKLDRYINQTPKRYTSIV